MTRSNSDITELNIPDAAKVLGISEAALRMRINRKSIKAVKRGGRVIVLIEQRLNSDITNDTTAPKAEAGIDPQVFGQLEAAVEMQRVEINRLLKDNNRLNGRLDELIEQLKREQVLRQQQQNQLQGLLDRIALPKPDAAD